MGGPFSSKHASLCVLGKKQGGAFSLGDSYGGDSMSRTYGRATCIYVHLFRQHYVTQIIVHNTIHLFALFAHRSFPCMYYPACVKFLCLSFKYNPVRFN